MNTRNTTSSSFFTSKEDYLAFKAYWKELARQKAITRLDAALRALVLGQDVDHVFPVTKNPRRLANGAKTCSGRWHALGDLSYEALRVKHRLEGKTDVVRSFEARWASHGLSPVLLASLLSLSEAARVAA